MELFYNIVSESIRLNINVITAAVSLGGFDTMVSCPCMIRKRAERTGGLFYAGGFLFLSKSQHLHDQFLSRDVSLNLIFLEKFKTSK